MEKQNIESVKSLLKNPITLAIGIIAIFNALLALMSGVIVATRINMTSRVVNLTGLELKQVQSTLQTIKISVFLISIDVISILTAITFIMFFVNSKNSENRLKTPAVMFKVTSVVRFIFACITAVVSFVGICALMYGLGFLKNGMILRFIDDYITIDDKIRNFMKDSVVWLLLSGIMTFLHGYFMVKFSKALYLHSVKGEIVKNYAIPLLACQTVATIVFRASLLDAYNTFNTTFFSPSAIDLCSAVGSFVYSAVMMAFIIMYLLSLRKLRRESALDAEFVKEAEEQIAKN